ncbi:MAG: hypothetical protein ACE5FE_01740 [Acidiferrobacterales bacterium]
MKFAKTIILLVAALVVTPAFAQDDMQILREKIKADKKLVVAVNMGLTESEAKGFWPVYDAYQKDLHKINERLAGLIVDYADAYNKGMVPDATAKKLLKEALNIEEAELKLKRAYVPKLEKALPDWKVARYLQIETKIRAIVKYELAAEVPLVE